MHSNYSLYSEWNVKIDKLETNNIWLNYIVGIGIPTGTFVPMSPVKRICQHASKCFCYRFVSREWVIARYNHTSMTFAQRIQYILRSKFHYVVGLHYYKTPEYRQFHSSDSYCEWAYYTISMSRQVYGTETGLLSAVKEDKHSMKQICCWHFFFTISFTHNMKFDWNKYTYFLCFTFEYEAD